jgi:phosphatidylinositol alpha-1,6-mannosyltransferase
VTALRVLALVTDAFGGHGGIAQYNRDFLSALAGCQGIDEIIVLPRAGEERPGKIPAKVRQLTPIKSKLAYSLAALRLRQTHSPTNVIFCGHAFMAPLAAALAKLGGSHLWMQVHGIEAWQELSVLHRKSIEAADLVTSVSRYTRRRLLQWVGSDPARVKILPDTLNPRFRPGVKPGYLLDRHALGGRKVLMTVSRLAASEQYKGNDRVIRALRRVLREHPDAIYLVVGDGDDRPRLEALALQCGVVDKVMFVGHVAPIELPDYYRLADVFVMPSTGEGFGIVFLEAMASGVPVIGGNKDGSLDPLADGEAGTAVDPDDIEALASAICATLCGPTTLTDGPSRFNQRAFAAHVQDLVASRIVADGLAVL